jgi:STAM-binding protein
MRGPLNIAAKTKKLDVDNRLSLKLYYRTADNLLKQVCEF